MSSRKIGWLTYDKKLGKYKGKEVAVHTQEMHVAVTLSGEKSSLKQKTSKSFELDAAGRLVFAEERTLQNDIETLTMAVGTRGGLVITTQIGGRAIKRRVPTPKETLSLMRDLDRWLRGPPAEGSTFESYSTSLHDNVIDIKELYTFQGKKSIVWGGVPSDFYLVHVRKKGAVFDAEIRSDGTIVKGRIGKLFEIRAEKEAIAKKVDAAGIDLLAASSIRVDKDLGDPRNVESLTLEISGLGDFALPSSHRQRLRTGGGGTVIVELQRDYRTGPSTPLTKEQRARYSKSTAALQSSHRTIRRLAGQIVGRERNPVKAAALFAKWIYRSLDKTNSADASSALQVLENGSGDCTEHTLLFVALARAADIPARAASGLVYVDADPPMFGWHEWAEIHDGSQWVTIDPTLNEVYVDSTHIKFSEGFDNWAWVNVVGTARLKVLGSTLR